MKRLFASVCVALLLGAGCSKKPPSEPPAREPSASVTEAIRAIACVDFCVNADAVAGGEKKVFKRIDVAKMTVGEFKRELEGFPGEDVHVWMPGETLWILTGTDATNRLSLARIMDTLAADTNITLSVAEIFASYAGTREEILPAFAALDPSERALPEFFVTKEIAEIGWLDCTEIDADILKEAQAAIRSAQFVRRMLLEGAVESRLGHSDRSIELWSKVAKRNPNDPMFRERLERLWINSEVFLKVGQVKTAAKCCETILRICPRDRLATERMIECLLRLGEKDMAEELKSRLK